MMDGRSNNGERFVADSAAGLRVDNAGATGAPIDLGEADAASGDDATASDDRTDAL